MRARVRDGRARPPAHRGLQGRGASKQGGAAHRMAPASFSMVPSTSERAPRAATCAAPRGDHDHWLAFYVSAAANADTTARRLRQLPSQRRAGLRGRACLGRAAGPRARTDWHRAAGLVTAWAVRAAQTGLHGRIGRGVQARCVSGALAPADGQAHRQQRMVGFCQASLHTTRCSWCLRLQQAPPASTVGTEQQAFVRAMWQVTPGSGRTVRRERRGASQHALHRGQ